MTRKYAQLGTDELEALSKGASPERIRELLHELSFRSRAGARRLADQLAAQLAGVESSGLSAAANSSEAQPTSRARLTAPVPIRSREVPTNPSTSPPTSPGARKSGIGGPPRNAGAKFTPTTEQSEAIDRFARGGSLKITAFAGAGKTSTLQLLAQGRGTRGLYLAFNRSIANEARARFATGVDCRTTHSLALSHVRGRHAFSEAKLFNKIGPTQLASAFALSELSIASTTRITPQQLAFLMLSGVRRFCASSDETLGLDHIQLSGRLVGLPQQVRLALSHDVLNYTRRLWHAMISTTDAIPLGHDGYLKLWALDRPALHYDFLMLDEAQDTNPAVLGVLEVQTHPQMVYVGDAHQQIYEWRGAVNAMSRIATDHHVYLTESFRFGEVIAEAASRLLSTLGERHTLRGSVNTVSQIVDHAQTEAVLARTNSKVISETLAATNNDRVPHIIGGTAELEELAKDVFSLQDGNPGSHPDFFGFANWAEVVAHAETEEGAQIRPFVNLVQQHGPKRIWAAIKSSESDESKADVVISTAHKSKGREWESVRISDDFISSTSSDRPIPESEVRLLYVAITRAKKLLAIDRALLNAYAGARTSHSSLQEERSRTHGDDLRKGIMTPSDTSPSRTMGISRATDPVVSTNKVQPNASNSERAPRPQLRRRPVDFLRDLPDSLPDAKTGRDPKPRRFLGFLWRLDS